MDADLTALFPYQTVGAAFLAEKGRALLADDMGLGKSAQAIAACNALAAVNICVICPAVVVHNWFLEFARFGRGIVPQVYSYDAARKGINGHYDVLILDEVHFLKTRTAKRTKAIFGDKCDGVGGLVERAEHVFMLSGTPTPNNPSELWPMLRAVVPGSISAHSERGTKPLSYRAFVQKYCRTRDNGFGIQIVGGKNLAELKERIGPYVLRRKKEDVLKDLPPIRFAELPLEGDLSLSADAKTETWTVDKILSEEGVAGLAKLAPHVATLRRLTGMAKVAPAVEWIKDFLDGGGKKLVVFAYHRDVLAGLFAGVDRWSETTMLTGDMPGFARQEAVDAFQNEAKRRLFIGQIQAAGTGITLTAASDVLFCESSWVPADNEQAAMRVHRIGQKNACLIRFATLAGSIDQRIQRAVMRKTADIAKLFG